MTKQIKNSIFFILIIRGLYSCDVMDTQKLQIYNNTKDTLFCYWDTEKNASFLGNNPLNGQLTITEKDTIWEQNSNNLMFPKAHSSFSDYNWKNTISESKLKRLYIHFYNVCSFLGKGQTINDTIKCDTTLTFTYDELKNLNWQVELKNNP